MQTDRELRYQDAMEIRRDLDVILTTPAVNTGVQTIQTQPPVTSKPRLLSPQHHYALELFGPLCGV